MLAITIFTPAYNRAALLPRLYQSLCEQTVQSFEWLVVDDGSTDDTPAFFETLNRTNPSFPVRCVRQENGGKMRAVNRGVSLAQGELFFIVDSDDALVPDAVETVLKWRATLGDGNGFAGIAGDRAHFDKKKIGRNFVQKSEKNTSGIGSDVWLDATTLERSRYHITGDKAEVFFMDVLRKFPFPEFGGENFVPEALVWNRIAQAGYRMRWFPKTIYLCDYLADGYSAHVDECLVKNWQGYSLYVKELMQSRAPLKDKILIGGAYCLRKIKRGKTT